MAPEWTRTALIAPDDVKIADFDAYKNQKIGKEFGIRGFPTLLVFKDGFYLHFSLQFT